MFDFPRNWQKTFYAEGKQEKEARKLFFIQIELIRNSDKFDKKKKRKQTNTNINFHCAPKKASYCITNPLYCYTNKQKNFHYIEKLDNNCTKYDLKGQKRCRNILFRSSYVLTLLFPLSIVKQHFTMIVMKCLKDNYSVSKDYPQNVYNDDSIFDYLLIW